MTRFWWLLRIVARDKWRAATIAVRKRGAGAFMVDAKRDCVDIINGIAPAHRATSAGDKSLTDRGAARDALPANGRMIAQRRVRSGSSAHDRWSDCRIHQLAIPAGLSDGELVTIQTSIGIATQRCRPRRRSSRL